MALFRPRLRGIKILATICGYGVINVGLFFAAKEIVKQEKAKQQQQASQTAQNNAATILGVATIPKWMI